MNDTHTSVLSAFCDGEPVDPDAFAAALADPEARDALIDFVRLRRAVQTEPEALPEPLAVMRRPPRPVWRMSIPLPAVAALLLLVLLGAWMLPRPAAPPAPSSDTPPTPTRVVKYVPGVDWQND